MDDKKIVYKGRIFTISQYPSGDGRTFETCERPDSVEVIPITEDKKIILIKQFRRNYPKGVYSFPGGRVGKDQSREEAAQRELQEEAHVKANKLEFFFENFKPSTLVWRFYVYIGRDLVSSELPRDPDERIVIEEKSLEEVVDIAYNGLMYPDINSWAAFRFYHAVQKGDFKL